MEQGYSTRINDDDFKAAMRAANRTYVITVLLTLILLPPALTAIAALFTREGLPVLIGACLIVWIITACVAVSLLVKRFLGKSWEGTVTRQYTRRVRQRKTRTVRRVYVTECETENGRRKRYKESNSRTLYDYLSLGDRVRYHPQLNYPLEKFDKSGDESVVCPFCGTLQSIDLDICGACRKPLLK